MKYHNQILNKRETTHGDYVMVSTLAQKLKANIRHHVLSELSEDQRESLDMICSKIGRICSGNPNEVDHWRDIAGYAELVVARLEGKGTHKHVVEQPKREDIRSTHRGDDGTFLPNIVEMMSRQRIDPTAPGFYYDTGAPRPMPTGGNISGHPTPPLPYADKSPSKDGRVRL